MKNYFVSIMLIVGTLFVHNKLYGQHFTPCTGGDVTAAMTITIIEANLNGNALESGDEIGVYGMNDTTKCLGTYVISNVISISNPALIIVNKKVSGSECGYVEDDSLVFKYWINSKSDSMTLTHNEITFVDQDNGLEIEPLTYTFGVAVVQLNADRPVYFNLSMALSPVNSGTVTPDLGTHQYVSGEVVSITATPLPGYVFDGWGGDVANPDDSNTTVTMTEDRIVTAYFTEEVVPVELTSFSARYESQERGVLLRWSTATEMNNYGFSIERRYEETGSEWQEIGFVEGHGTTTQRHGYEYVDREHERSGAYTYRLKQIDMDGSVTYSEALRVGVEKVMTCVLHQNYPNPFNPETLIEFEVGERTDVEIELVDMLGRRVAVIMQGTYESGRHEVLFNARDLSSGIYFYRLKTAAFEQVRKLAVIK